MAWFLADDRLGENAKVLELLSRPNGFAALGFWTICGTWSRANRTSGDVPRTAADASARKSGHYSDASELAAALVDVGLWVETPTGYRFHDWEGIYREETKAAERKAKDAERKRLERAGQRPDKQPDASKDSPRTIRRTPGPSPSPSPSPISDPPVVPQGEERPRLVPENTQRDRSPSAGVRAQEFDEMFRAECFEREITPPSMGREQRVRIVQRVVDHQRAKGLGFPEACAALLEQAFADAAATDGNLVLALESCEPGKPKPPRYRGSNGPPPKQLSKAALEQLANPPRKFV